MNGGSSSTNGGSSSANGNSSSTNVNGSDMDGSSVGDVGCSSTNFHQGFTLDQLELFQRRFENDYDIPDPVYLQWLKVYHPSRSVELSVSPLNVVQGDATLSAVLNLSHEDEMIGLEHSMCLHRWFKAH